MQFPYSEATARSSIPPSSPWRGSQGSLDGSLRSGPGQSSFGQGANIKLPSLPRLGSHTNHSHNSGQRQPQQPSFAQLVQASQANNAPRNFEKGSDEHTKGSSNGSQSGPSSMGANYGDSESTKDTGAQILGSVNAQMMPKVNASYGMSSLNTVLPGMAPQNSLPSRTASSTSVSATMSKGDSSDGQINTQLMQNLNIQNRDSHSDASTVTQRPSDTERFGLRSLLDVIESKNKEKQNVILGSDMSQSGLDMSSSADRLSHIFASPWQETSRHHVTPDYKLPACYRIETVIPQQQKLQSFDEGALFYIFYTMPRDAMQEAAAIELTNRSWRYHKELKMWLTKDPLSEPIQTDSQEESGIYIFFDPTTWKKIKREYVLYYPDIA